MERSRNATTETNQSTEFHSQPHNEKLAWEIAFKELSQFTVEKIKEVSRSINDQINELDRRMSTMREILTLRLNS